METATLRTGSGSGHDRGTKWILVGSMIAAVLLGWRAAERFPGAAMPGGGAFLFVFGLLTLGGRRPSVVVDRDARALLPAGGRDPGGPPGRDRRPLRLRPPSVVPRQSARGGRNGIALGNWVSLAILVVIPTLGHLPRIWVEERALEESLGAEYSGYAGNRKRLVPGIW